MCIVFYLSKLDSVFSLKLNLLILDKSIVHTKIDIESISMIVYLKILLIIHIIDPVSNSLNFR